MTAPDQIHWLEANQRHLNGVLEVLRRRLEQHAGGEPMAPIAAGLGDCDTSAPLPALETLAATFGLTDFEKLVVALIAGIELDTRFAAACADALGGVRRPTATFSLALAVVPDGHWSALSPAAPLRRWRLIEPAAGEALATAPLRIDERVLHYLTGVAYIDDRLDGLVEPAPLHDTLPASHEEVARRAAAVWTRNSRPPWPVVQLCGIDQGSKTAIAADACHSLDMGLLRLRLSAIPHAAGERTALARLCERELALSQCALLLVDDDDATGGDGVRTLSLFAEEMAGPLLIAAREPIALESRPKVRLDVEKPGHAEQRTLWMDALGPLAERFDGQLETLITHFDLDTNAIRAASGIVADVTNGSEVSFERLWDSCRVQARRRLDDLAQRIQSGMAWDDLVLPPGQKAVLREIAVHMRHCRTVYETWGFAAKSNRGLGISVLFAGPSGTGKTLAAEVLANELRLDLYRIDLSQVVSKYIGETEKNMRRIFAAAEESGAVLLFDEADALFGKRSEVKDSHDRYANIEVSYLLQRMEAYRGLAILTTNIKSALDQAFMRRIRFVIQFPFPDATLREEIWRRVFPNETPTEHLDARRLSRMNVAGGNIRNIAVNAAFLAAEARTAVQMTHVVRAARNEYAKLEKPLTNAELGGPA